VTKTVTLEQSGTTLTAELADGKTDNAYEYGDTITSNAKVEASGKAPAMTTMSLTEPTPGQVAVYKENGTTQVSAPATPGADGTCTLTVAAKDLGQGNTPSP